MITSDLSPDNAYLFLSEYFLCPFLYIRILYFFLISYNETKYMVLKRTKSGRLHFIRTTVFRARLHNTVSAVKILSVNVKPHRNNNQSIRTSHFLMSFWYDVIFFLLNIFQSKVFIMVINSYKTITWFCSD